LKNKYLFFFAENHWFTAGDENLSDLIYDICCNCARSPAKCF